MERIKYFLNYILGSPVIRKVVLFLIFLWMAIWIFNYLDRSILSMNQQITQMKKDDQLAQDFLSNSDHYVFESGVKVNQYISSFIAQSIAKQTDAKILGIKKEVVNNVRFFQSYLPVEVIEFTIVIQGRYSTILALAKTLKDSPFRIIWKQFSFLMSNYPIGNAQLVFYTFVKKG